MLIFRRIHMSKLKGNFSEKAKQIIKTKQFNAINHPNGVMKRILNKSKKKVTVVTAAYNAEKFIGKTIDSVLNQSLGSENIEYIIVDDSSTDQTKEIVKSYIAKNKNVSLISLKENTGSPGTPRNIGIELATTEYITFLDADDWLHPKGLESLYSILEETKDDYVVGKTIKVEKAGETVIGEFASVKERRSITPYDVPHFFYHMGPTARMMKREILMEHNIRFPEMRFGEDKLFFSDLFFHARAVSTTTAPIYYANRLEENNASLTRTTDVLDKRRNDLEIIKYIQDKQLPLHMEKTALTRIYEYDFLRTFDSNLFVNGKNKEEFIELFKEVIKTTEDLRYNFLDEFKTPFYKAATALFLEGRIKEFTELFSWLKKEKNKQFVIKDGKPYYEIPFLEDQFHLIRVPMLARALESEVIENKEYKQTFEIYGDFLDDINEIIIRDRKKVGNDLRCDFEITGNTGHFTASADNLDNLETSLFTVFVRYNEYQLLNIKVIPKNLITHGNKEFMFYTTKADNLGLSIKPLK
jgi:glycosyltransferase involved in cell wall biosynthesis